MTTYKILCDPTEAKEFSDDVTVIETYPSFAIVDMPAQRAQELGKKYPIEELRLGEPSADEKATEAMAAIATTSAAAATSGRPLGDRRIVAFIAPVRDNWLARLESMGAHVQSRLGRSRVTVKLSDPSIEHALTQEGFVAKVSSFTPRLRLTREFIESLVSEEAKSAGEIAVSEVANRFARGDIQRRSPRNIALPGTVVADFQSKEDADDAAEAIIAMGVSILSRSRPTRLVLDLLSAINRADALKALIELPGLRALGEKKMKIPFNDRARDVIGVTEVAENPTGSGLTGQGEIVAVADTGLDTGNAGTIHADFSNSVRDIQSFPIGPALANLVNNPGGDDGAADVYSGHGTHVAGSVKGSGARAIALGLTRIAGAAPDAELVFQAVEQTPQWTPAAQLQFLLAGITPPQSGLFGIPDNMADLLQPAYDEGARIHSNSWGGGDPGDYDEQCSDLDQFVWDHPDLLVVAAAGNAGTDQLPPAGTIDPTSVDSPGTAKNCLTVGACENDRNGEFQDTYGAWWPGDFPNPPLKSDPMVDTIDDVVAFSSRGPCNTGRRKPDVIAPGTFVLSTRSSQIPANNFAWGPFPAAKKDYMFMGGTSMATPLVSGCAALIRQHLRQNLDQPNPSAALLKAALIHSAQYIDYRHAHPSSAAPADNEQGWGRVDIATVIAPEAPVNVLFIDEINPLATGEKAVYRIGVEDTSAPLRVTLVYTDFPGEDLVNDLSLVVRSPGGGFFLGNDFDNAGSFDHINNVEGVIVDEPTAGEWRVEVVASEVEVDPQHLAVVISGPGVTRQ